MPRCVAPVLALLAVLAVSACDGSGTPGDARTPGATTSAAEPDPLSAGIAALYVGDNPTPEEVDEGACFAAAFLERIDPDQLRAAGIVDAGGAVVRVPPPLDVATAEIWVEAQSTCSDFYDVSTRALVTQSKGKVDPDAYESCLRDSLGQDQVDAALVDTLTGTFDTPAVAALSSAQADCARSASPSD